ncbi:Hypothetical protein NCS54_00369200 [Fusarium falciforme]|uniref:Hypothetical protein n=1 Tax=Fusarium falciforme TaxID=195108 RepID=UPI0023006BD9|nr:Hypothetical protein NCS54_00369200 [Fusarium falciforme]WAO86419.1 Hypothetical protein NCS54_00369200 [Fusarium falciforme]
MPAYEYCCQCGGMIVISTTCTACGHKHLVGDDNGLALDCLTILLDVSNSSHHGSQRKRRKKTPRDESLNTLARS